MGPITALIPVSRSMPCGGEMVEVSQLRLRDLALIQSVLDGQWPDPLTEIQERIMTMESGPGRNGLLVEAYERAEIGPVCYGTAAGNEYFAGPEGAALLFWVAVRETPGITPSSATEILSRGSAGEIAAIYRFSHGVSVLKALESYLWADTPESPSAPGLTWPEMIDDLSRKRHWTYDYIYSLTFREWLSARNEGIISREGRTLAPGEDVYEAARRQKEIFSGRDGSGGTAP
jgi:hypothetical protein